MAARAPDYRPGDVLPGTKYTIVRQLGVGGMGVVYQVVKPPEIQGVLKLMSSDLTAHEEFLGRFLDEVRVLAQLEHPNIVRVFDYDKLEDGTPFFVMELLVGKTVRDVLLSVGKVPPRVAFEVTRQLLEALHCAHTHDVPVVHRDIKPENVFLHAPRHADPIVKLIDFGVVAIADQKHDGVFVGTWKYAAPEQIRGLRATPATDLYAVGLLLYEMLCGMGPFDQFDSGQLISQAHLTEIPPPVSKFAPWVPKSIVDLIARSLSKNPLERPRDAYAFAEGLYDLEWASDDSAIETPGGLSKTSEGPLSRMLSRVEAARGSSKKMAAAAPAKDRLGEVPLIGVPPESLHIGNTLRGMGTRHEPTTPGEDALLEGLVARPDVRPRSKKARESGPTIDSGPHSPRAGRVIIRANDERYVVQTPVTLRTGNVEEAITADAPPSSRRIPFKRRSDSNETDTFASHQTDPRGVPRGSLARVVVPLAAGAIAILVLVGFFVYRRGPDVPPVAMTNEVAITPPPPTAAAAAQPAEVATVPPAVSSAPRSVTVKGSASGDPSAKKFRGAAPPIRANGKPAASQAPPAASTKVDPGLLKLEGGGI